MLASAKDHTDFDMDRIQNTDTEAMLVKVAKDLKRTDYKLLHLVTSGTNHLTKLKVTS